MGKSMSKSGFFRSLSYGRLSFALCVKRALCIAIVGVMAAFCFALTGGCSHTSNYVAPQPPSVLPNGRVITPAGTTSGPVGGMPLNIVLSPDGKYAITTSNSYVTSLCSVRVSDGTIVSQINFDTSIPNNGLYYGLVFAPGNSPPPYTLYAAQGAYGTVAIFTLGANGTLTQTQTPTTIPAAPQPTPVDQPAGLALDSRGYLYVTNTLPLWNYTGYPGASTLSIFTTAGVRQGTGYTFPGQTPCYPLAITVKSDGSAAYVASERDDCVYVLNTTVPTAPTLTATISTGDHPDALLLNKAQTRLFVANAGSDYISVIDTNTNRVLSTVLLRPSNVSNLPGVTPTGLALSSDEETLYASLGDFNAVGVIDTATSRLRGYIPVGWYPTAVAASPDDRCLLVTNGWGTTAVNPNPQFSFLNGSTNGYVMTSIPGNVSRVDLTKALPALAASTVQVVQNTQNTPAAGSSAAANAMSGLGIKYGNIKHVIYIIKENHGYDSIMGDLPKGNGDPSLTLFGQDVTPNQHKLTMRFILLDNYYNNAPVSNEAWQWCTQSMANEFSIRNVPYMGRTGGPAGPNDGAFVAQDANYITGGYPAKDCDGNWLSSNHLSSPPVQAVAEAPGGYIWDKVHDAGLTYRNYGFYLSLGIPQNPSSQNLPFVPPPQNPPFVVPDNYPTVANLQPPGHMPVPPGQISSGNTDYDFRQFDFGYADSDAWVQYGLTAAQLGLYTVPANDWPAQPGYYTHSNKASSPQAVPPQPSRFSEWNREFQYMLTQDPTGGTVPTFMMVRFMRDHTVGYAENLGSPRAMMADNDYAVGELVEKVSHSPIWESTVIFVIEDDAQEDGDHVDAHRSYIQVISPWIKQGTLDSHFYNTNSVLKSMELLLGLPPMSQYDAFTNPIMGGWDSAPNNNAPYDAIRPAKNIIREVNPPTASYKRNDPRRRLALLCAKMNFRVADAAPAGLLNDALWMSVKGPNSKRPKPRFNELKCLNQQQGHRAKPGDDD